MSFSAHATKRLQSRTLGNVLTRWLAVLHADGMARSDVGTNDVVALQRDLAARATGGWRVLRGIYTDDVRAIVEAAGSLSLGDLQRVELAEYLSMVELLRSAEDPGDRLIERLESLKLQSRKQLARITEAMGPTVDANTQPVTTPEWLAEPLIRIEATMRVLMERMGDQLDRESMALVQSVLDAAASMPAADVGDSMMD